MQALFLFVLFGLFFAVVQGLISGGAQSAIQLKLAQEQGTEAFFRDIEDLMNDQIIPQNLRVPNLGNDISAYLDLDAVREGVNWNYSNSTTEDPWQVPFTGFVVHQRVPVRAQTDGGQVHLPITGFLLVSAGPDRFIDPALQARINALTPLSEIRDLLNVGTISGSDDIVYTFSTYTALEDRWQEVETRVSEILQSVSRQYTNNYLLFLEQLLTIYGPDYLDFFNDEGSLILTAANTARWRADGIVTPIPDMVNFENSEVFGSQGAQSYITDDSNLRLRFEAYRSGTGIRNPECRSTTPQTLSDRLRICVSNNGSPWGDVNGRLFYYDDVEGERS